MRARAIDVQCDGEYVLLPVRVQAGARHDAIIGEHGGRLKVSVIQAAEKGKANREVIRLLAGSLEVSRSQVSVWSGATSSQKVMAISSVSESEVRDWLERVCGSSP